jgi:hypothetical protein
MLASMLGAALLAMTPAAVQAQPPAAQTAQDGAVYFAGEPEGIGDPNPYYENGVYSIFYLKNEGRHPWWMSQTSDLNYVVQADRGGQGRRAGLARRLDG